MIVGLGSISACAFGDGGPRSAGVSPIGNTYARRGGAAECFRFCRLVQAVAFLGNGLDGFYPTCFDFRAGSLNWPFLFWPLPCLCLHEFTNSTLLETRGRAGWAFFEVRFLRLSPCPHTETTCRASLAWSLFRGPCCRFSGGKLLSSFVALARWLDHLTVICSAKPKAQPRKGCRRHLN